METNQQNRYRRTRKNNRSSSSSSSRHQSNTDSEIPLSKIVSLNHKYIKPKESNNRSNNLNSNNEEDFPAIIGTCAFMCPAKERAQRERLRDLAVFERLDGNPGKTSVSLAVKKFCRTISSRSVQVSDVRPLPLLEETLNYLFNLMNCREYPFEVLHDFIFDRIRSIRQDLSMQNIIGLKSIVIYERMVKFHVISHQKLQQISSGNLEMSPMYHLNIEQLTKTLLSLFDLYEENRRNSNSICENEAEFRSYYVLLILGAQNQSRGESLSLWFRRIPNPIIKAKEMCFARRVLRYYHIGNYNRLISTTEAEASYFQYCIIQGYINEIRALALRCLNYGGYKLHPYPLADLSKLLLMKASLVLKGYDFTCAVEPRFQEELDVESLCSDCGLQIVTDETGNKFLPAKQTSFLNSKIRFKKFYQVNSERFERESAECHGC